MAGGAGGADPAFRADVLAGLTARPRTIPARWFYDHQGSLLFEQITLLPEYYPTRVEAALIERHAPDVAALGGRGRAVVEFGSGSSAKTPPLLHAVSPAAYVPIDISGEFLRSSAAALAAQLPNIPIHPVEADFTSPIRLPPAIAEVPRLGFFPGSTIGNLVPAAAVDLLRGMRDTLGQDALLLIGMDRIKDQAVLVDAYDDAAGVTAAFNLNLLHRINRELGGTIPVDRFRHRAIWNGDDARVEMHLEAVSDLSFEVAGEKFEIAAGETIHTENSHKYGPRDARLLLAAGGWTTLNEWTDEEARFALILAEAQPVRTAP